MKNGSIVNLGCTAFISFLSLIRWVASISSENVKKGIESDSVIVFVIAFLMPVICFTLTKILLFQKVNLLVLISDACKGSDLIAMSAGSFLDLLSGVDNFDCFFLTFTLSTTTYKVYDVSLCHSAVLS